MTTALLNNHDYLFFFDSDVFPKILTKYSATDSKFEEIDFIGEHLKALNSDRRVVASTSDYTGFYIIPKMKFPHLNDLLYGIQKEEQYERIITNQIPVFSEKYGQNIRKTKKVLGGNLAINFQNYK